jgi:hypothetical protein
MDISQINPRVSNNRVKQPTHVVANNADQSKSAQQANKTQETNNSQPAKSAQPSEGVSEGIDRHSFNTHKFAIGAKVLMQSLTSSLQLGKSIQFEHFKSETFQIKQTHSQPLQLDKLDKIQAKPFEFDFEAVAKSVMDFVSGAIMDAKNNGADDQRLNEMLGQAQSGVEQGFDLAREDLGTLDMLTPQLEQGLTKSYGLIQSGLEKLEQDLFAQDSAEAVPGKGNISGQQLDFSEQEQGSISITTREGDEINIHFGSTSSLSQQQITSDGTFSSQVSFSQSQSFSLQIEGDINESEQQAINGLIKDIGKLADNFFGGDIEKAWQQGKDLGFDDSQIAGFSLDFREIKQINAVQQYASNSEETSSPIAQISPYIKDLNSILEQQSNLFEGDELKQLMTQVAAQHNENMDNLLDDVSQGFVDFNQRLFDALENVQDQAEQKQAEQNKNSVDV